MLIESNLHSMLRSFLSCRGMLGGPGLPRTALIAGKKILTFEF